MTETNFDFGKKKKIVEESALDTSIYSYDYMINRIFQIIGNKNIEKIILKLKPPKIYPISSRKCVWLNFKETCQALNRPIEHLMLFVYAELGTNGSVDSDKHLNINGKFKQKDIENILKKYIAEYVRCPNCRSLDTILTKENKINMIDCQSCRAKKSVGNIHQGYKAITKQNRLKNL